MGKTNENDINSLDELFARVKDLCEQEVTLRLVRNAINADVPNIYIRSMLDGQKHWDEIMKPNKPFYGMMEETEENDGKS